MSLGLAGCCFAALVAMSGCETTYTTRVSGVQVGNGGASSDLVFASNSPVGEQDDLGMYMASTRDASRRNASLGDSSAGTLPTGWWDEPSVPHIERPYWIHTSRNADTWRVPQRIEYRRDESPYWAR